ncbi:MAG: hypothetical protein IBX68_03665 [Dehalococcoidia bacterium]|nr:hypothetical protein [Dehalococcoidia bacterium]
MIWLKYMMGGVLTIAGLFGLVVIFIGTVVPLFITGIGRLDLEVAPSAILGVLGFIVFMGGVYLMRSA